MKKAVITTGGHQYVVSEGDVLEVELIHSDKKTVSLEPLLVIDGDKTTVGAPIVDNAKVTIEILGETRGDKVTAIRYKAKKRVKKIRGHKQHLTQVKVTKIS